MTAIRRCLATQAVELVSDATIGVIAFLAMSEAVDPGNLELSTTHMAAVENLVKVRGHQTISSFWYVH